MPHTSFFLAFLHLKKCKDSFGITYPHGVRYFSLIEEVQCNAELQDCSDLVGLWIGNGVSDADAVTLDEEPVVDDRLDVAVEPPVLLVTIL